MALEFFIKNLCIEIQQECKEKNILCHQNFMTYYLKLLSFDPLWNLYPKMKEINREDAVRIINYVVAKMKNQQCPCIISLKMHFYFICNFEPKELINNIRLSNFRIRLSLLTEEIAESRPENEQQYDLLLKQIIYFCSLWRGLGNPTKEGVYKEGYHAIVSFVDNSDLEYFVHKKVDEKMLHLYEIASIWAGVRIFNWTCKKGGEGIEDLTEILEQSINQFKNDLTTRLQSVMDKMDIITSAIDYCFIIEAVEIYTKEGNCTEYKQLCEISNDIQYEEIEFFKDMIIVLRQVEVFSRQLLDVNEFMEVTSDDLRARFQSCVESFHSITHLKAGVPTRIIFPMFIQLDDIWLQYQNEIHYLKRMSQVLVDLDLYIKDLHIRFDVLEIIIDDKEILNDGDRLEVVNNEDCLEEKLFDLDVILPTSEMFKLDEIKLEILGFDLWRLVESQGALIPGNPNLGIVVFEERNYVFSCKESAFMFAKYPERYVNEMLELARKKVELINLLQLQEDLRSVQTLKKLVSDTKLMESTVAHFNASQQTEVHAVLKNIDTKYQWNIWDHKRNALKLCNLSHSVSTSTNTSTTHGIFSSATQTFDPKDKNSQTPQDNYTNTHTPQTYFFGLRGRKDDQQFILDLTKPPEKS